MNYANPVLLSLRRIGQRLGIVRPLAGLYRRVFRVSYEERFEEMLLADFSSSEVVWDIGANLGHFTGRFLDKLSEGQVIAFEPAPATNASLSARFRGRSNLIVEQIALSNTNGLAEFCVSSEDATAPTNSLATKSAVGVQGARRGIEVLVTTGDSYCSLHPGRIPNRLKIDVEGFELEVLQGMKDLLQDRRLRRIFIEVHFAILAQRGSAEAPEKIVNLLEKSGFKVSWTDPSHCVGYRA